jgi:hypothetical protein
LSPVVLPGHPFEEKRHTNRRLTYLVNSAEYFPFGQGISGRLVF